MLKSGECEMLKESFLRHMSPRNSVTARHVKTDALTNKMHRARDQHNNSAATLGMQPVCTVSGSERRVLMINDQHSAAGAREARRGRLIPTSRDALDLQLPLADQ